MAKNRHPRKSAGHWERLRQTVQPPFMVAPIKREPTPSPFHPCGAKGCRLMTAADRCSAHTESAPRRGIRWALGHRGAV